MKHESPKQDLESFELSVDDLKTKQSVRTTFKLPVEIIDLLGVIAGQIGIKQKTLLDQLSENTAILNKLAHEARNVDQTRGKRRQKTFVMSRRALYSINQVAKQQHIPRDVLVEVSIRRLQPIIVSELKKHNIRKSILEEMHSNLDSSKKIRTKTKKLLGTNDPLFEMIDKQVRLVEKNIAALDAIVEKGMPMEEW